MKWGDASEVKTFAVGEGGSRHKNSVIHKTLTSVNLKRITRGLVRRCKVVRFSSNGSDGF